MNGISAPADCCCNDIGDVEVRLRAGSLSDAYCLISKLQQQKALQLRLVASFGVSFIRCVQE